MSDSLTVKILINNSYSGFHGAGPQDTFTQARSYTFTPSLTDPEASPAEAVTAAAETMFTLLNKPEDYCTDDERKMIGDYHQFYSSLSVGDVVIVGETALAVAKYGFKPYALTAERIVNRVDAAGRHIRT